MPSNNSLIPSLWAAKRAKPSLASSAAVGGVVFAAHYSPLTPAFISRVLRTAAANQSGTTASVSLSALAISSCFLFAVGNDRFIFFSRLNGTDRVGATVFTVGASSFTAGTPAEIFASSTNIKHVEQSPTNPLQFLVTTSDGYTHLVTVAASGTTFTTSSHNTGGAISSFTYNAGGLGRITFASDGASAVTIGVNSTTGVAALFTISGTTLSYVTNATLSSWTISAIESGLCALTGGANNETMASLARSASGINFARFTFTTSAITVGNSGHITSGATSMPAGAKGLALGNIHTYAGGASPYPTTRLTIDGSATGTAHTSYLINGLGLETYYAKCPVGAAAFWGLGDSATTSNGSVPHFNGAGVGLVGSASLVTRSTQDPVGFCVSHDGTKAIAALQSASSPASFQFLGFNCPTS